METGELTYEALGLAIGDGKSISNVHITSKDALAERFAESKTLGLLVYRFCVAVRDWAVSDTATYPNGRATISDTSAASAFLAL